MPVLNYEKLENVGKSFNLFVFVSFTELEHKIEKGYLPVLQNQTSASFFSQTFSTKTLFQWCHGCERGGKCTERGTECSTENPCYSHQKALGQLHIPHVVQS
jgi:hypothetical protein